MNNKSPERLEVLAGDYTQVSPVNLLDPKAVIGTFYLESRVRNFSLCDPSIAGFNVSRVDLGSPGFNELLRERLTLPGLRAVSAIFALEYRTLSKEARPWVEVVDVRPHAVHLTSIRGSSENSWSQIRRDQAKLKLWIDTNRGLWLRMSHPAQKAILAAVEDTDLSQEAETAVLNTLIALSQKAVADRTKQGLEQLGQSQVDQALQRAGDESRLESVRAKRLHQAEANNGQPESRSPLVTHPNYTGDDELHRS